MVQIQCLPSRTRVYLNNMTLDMRRHSHTLAQCEDAAYINHPHMKTPQYMTQALVK